jgi:hypothetical protein
MQKPANVVPFEKFFYGRKEAASALAVSVRKIDYLISDQKLRHSSDQSARRHSVRGCQTSRCGDHAFGYAYQALKMQLPASRSRSSF